MVTDSLGQIEYIFRCTRSLGQKNLDNNMAVSVRAISLFFMAVLGLFFLFFNELTLTGGDVSARLLGKMSNRKFHMSFDGTANWIRLGWKKKQRFPWFHPTRHRRSRASNWHYEWQQKSHLFYNSNDILVNLVLLSQIHRGTFDLPIGL